MTRLARLAPALLLLAAEATYTPIVIDTDGQEGVSIEEYIGVCNRAFVKADANFDGSLSGDEALALFETLMQADMAYVHARADADGDGGVDQREMMEFVDAMRAQSEKASREMAEAMPEAPTVEDGANPEDVLALALTNPRHHLSRREQAALRKRSQGHIYLLSENGAYTLLEFQDAMRAKHALLDINGDGAVTADEPSFGTLFSM